MKKSPMQEHIEDIFARKAKCGDNDTSLADVLERDITTSFAGGNKFIYELLQNADDAGKGGGLDVSFRVIQCSGTKYLLFSHNGAHFEVGDVDKITSYANQRVEEKTIDPNKIGYKGIGFKAIFTIAKSVVIFSKGYQFRFDSEYKKWKQCEKGQAYPWQIIPIWTEVSELPEPVRASMVDPSRVNFLVKIAPKSNIESALEFIQSNTRILLFLRRVQKLTISISEKNTSIIEAKRRMNGRCDIYLDGQAYRSWLIKSFAIAIPQPIRQMLTDMSSHACPDRLKKAENVTISFAALVENGRLIRGSNLYVYCYLPTQVNCGLPFVINGDFLLDPARAHLADNQWNQFLLGMFAQKQFEWLAELARTETYRPQILNILSHDHLSAVPAGMSESFKAEFAAASRRVAFIPDCSPQELLLLSQAIIDDTGFYKIFTDLAPSSRSKRLVSFELENLALFNKLNVEAISFSALLKQIELHAQANKTTVFQVRLIRFIKDNEKKLSAASLKTAKFLLAHDGMVVEPSKLYFPAQGDMTEFPGYKELKFLHLEIYEAFSKEREVKRWLKDLGINQSDPLQFVRGYVFDLINKKGVTVNNVVALTRFVMHVARDQKLTATDWDTLSKMPVLAENGSLLRSFDAYMPDNLRPVLPLQAHLQNKAVFVSKSYFTSLDPEKRDFELESWHKFFIKIGVNCDITFVSDEITIEHGRERLAFFGDYLTYLKRKDMTAKKIQETHRILHIIYAPLMSQVTNPAFSKILVRRMLEQWRTITSGFQSCYRDNGSGAPKVLGKSYLQFVFQKNACFLGHNKKLYKTTELFDPLFEPLISYDPALVVIDADLELTQEQLVFFKIKRQLSLDQCCRLLQKFNEGTELMCFSIVWRQLLQFEQTMKAGEKARLLKMDMLFPNQNDVLCHRDEIACFAVPGETPPLHSDRFLKCFSGFSQAEMVQIAKLLGVSVVGEQVRILDFDGKQPVLDQRTRAFLCGPVVDSSLWSYLGIAVWLEHRRLSVNAQMLWDKISTKFMQLEFFKVERLSYHFGDKSTMAVSVQVCLDGTNFYYVRDWKESPPRLSLFLKTLGSYLGLSEDTVFKLERLILVYNRKQVINEYLLDWHLPEQPNVKQIFPELFKPTAELSEDDSMQEKPGKFSTDDKMFADASDGDNSDEEFEQGSDSPEDSYELHTPPSNTKSNRDTPTATPMKKSGNNPGAPRQQSSPDLEGLPLVDVNKFDYGKLFKIQEAKLSVKNSSSSKVKVSVELYDSKEAKQPPVHGGSEPHGASHSPRSSDSKKTHEGEANSKNLDSQSKPALTKADKDKIGRCGEELIYRRQKYRYKKKYPNCKINKKANGFEVIGQDHQGEPVDIKVIWHNKDMKRDEDRDITIVKPKGKRYLEVKASTTDKLEFNWTAREFALARRKGDRYRLFHIASIGTDPKVVKIKDPATKLGTELQITGYKVKF